MLRSVPHGILLAVSMLCLGCGPSIPARPSVNVRTLPVRKGSLGTLLISSGEVRARRRAVLASADGGLITRLEVREGDHVIQGQPLIYLSVKRRETQVEVQRARVEQARSRLQQSQNQLQSAQAQHQHKLKQSDQSLFQARVSVQECVTQVDAAYADWQRKAQLLTQKAVSKVEVEQAQLQWKIKKDELSLARSREKSAHAQDAGVHDGSIDLRAQADQVTQAEGSLHEAQANLEDAIRQQTESILRAPITGIVTNLKVVAGQSVGADSLGQVIDSEDMEVIATLDPAQVGGLSEKTPGTLHSPLLGNKGAALRFVELIAAVEGKGNTVRARFRFLGKPSRRLVDGLQIQVHLQMPERKGWLVPRECMAEDQLRRNRVRVVRNQQEQTVMVTILGWDENYVLCTGKLREGDDVMVSGSDPEEGSILPGKT